MKRALTTALLVCIAAIAAFAYLHHRKLVRQREAFDAPSPAPTPASTASALQGSPTEASAPDLIHQLPAGASAVVFVDVAALRASSFANELANLAPTSAQDPAYTEFVHDTGFDYSRDLDRTAVDLWPQDSSTSVLALAQGRFDEAKIERYALRYGRLVKSHNQKVYEVREQNSTRLIRFSFLSPVEIALADGPALSQVLGAVNPQRLDSQMSERVALVSGTPIYAVARTQDLPKDLGIDASHSAQLAGLLRSVHLISASGRPAEDNLKVFASAECDSTLDALKLSTALQGLLWIGRAALADPKTRQQIGPQWPALDALLRAADISHNRRRVELRVEVTPQMLQATLAVPADGAPKK